MKIKNILILTLLLLFCCSVASAADINDTTETCNIHEPITEANVNTISDNKIITEEYNENIISDNTPKNTNINKKSIENYKTSTATFTLTDDTWDNYFRSNGTLKDDVVSEGNVLVFEGEFNDRFMMINIPVNITSSQEQACLTNCLFYVYANNINITGLNINNTDYDEYVMYLEDVSNIIIENNTLSLSNHDDGVTTHTINIDNSSDIIIRNNEIYTMGPEENLNHDTGVCVTASINVRSSNNITIDSNNITTEENGNTQFYGTIYGVYLRGHNINEKTVGDRIKNNRISTRGNYYMYSVSVVFAEDYLIENNIINTSSGEYSNGIQIEVVNRGVINNNTINITADHFTYGIYCAGREGKEIIYPTDNIISNNTIYAESITTYLIEFFIGQNNTISHNNLYANVSYGTGIGTSQAAYNIHEYNNINITFKMVGDIFNPDAIPDSPTGITITTLQPKYGVNNTIRYNNITVYSPQNKKIPAINLISTNNTAYKNYLISSLGISDEAVTYTSGNNVHDNYPADTKNVIIPLEDISISAGKTESILITFIDEDNNIVTEGRVEIYIDDKIQDTFNLTDYYIIYNIENLEIGTHNFTVNYIPLDDMTYNQATNTSTITVNKIDIQITYTPIQDTKYKDNVTITGTVKDVNGKALYNINAQITINNKQYKAKTDKTGTFTLKAPVNKIGTNNVTISYAGNAKYNSHTINTTFNVEKQDITITIDTIQDTQYKDNVTITGKIIDINNNPLYNINAQITINTKVYKAKTDKTGAFTLTAPVNKIGTNNVTISYGGNANYNSNTINTTFNVEKQDITITYDTIQDTKYKDNVTITGKVTDVNGKALSNINAIITINGKTYKAKTDTTVAFTLTAPVNKIGTNNVTISYGGNANYNSNEITTTFNVEKQDITIECNPIADTDIGEDVTITGVASDVNGNSLNNINVNIHINGKLFKAKTDTKGAFTLTTTASTPGTNHVTLSYNGNTNYNSTETITTFNVIAKNE